MRMRVLSIIAVLVLAVSCRSTESIHYTEDEIRNALMSLSSDMLPALDTSTPIGIDEILDALPLTYTAYAEYVPLYDSIASDYAEKLSAILSPHLPVPVHIISESASRLAESGSEQYINGDTSFSDGIRGETYQLVVDAYRDDIAPYSDELEAAFASSCSELNAVRSAYLNLSSVGQAVYISEPDMVDADAAAVILADAFFARLEESERLLKNTPSGISSGYYYVFWGGR